MPRESTWATKAPRSVSCSSVKAWALVPVVGTPCVRPASRFDVAAKPTRQAARAAATAACSCVRREPISMHGRPAAAETMRAPADAIAESWLRIDSSSVSSRTPSANVDSTTMTGDCGR